LSLEAPAVVDEVDVVAALVPVLAPEAAAGAVLEAAVEEFDAGEGEVAPVEVVAAEVAAVEAVPAEEPGCAATA
jgi:hypothetical protein